MKTKMNLSGLLVLITIALASCMKEQMACCELPETAMAGQPVSFSSSCSRDAGRYKWDFGDGNTSNDANPTHTYSAAGTYMVVMMALSRNDKKKHETSKSITVK